MRDRFYADVAEPLLVLEIESDLLDAEVREETVGDATYPHVYGPIPTVRRRRLATGAAADHRPRDQPRAARSSAPHDHGLASAWWRRRSVLAARPRCPRLVLWRVIRAVACGRSADDGHLRAA